MSMSADNQFAELEAQFIMRLPQHPASALREALKNGNPNLKDRMKLKLDNDLRHGTLYLDHYVLPSKLVDLPCVVEAHKSIDKKVAYKTSDVCQMLLCMEEEEPLEEETNKTPKKKDATKVDKKYIWPHGITPPMKNVRKRRFRKTLKKKQYLDQPEIEREVRRLLRTDYEAHHVSWEVIDEEEDKTKEGGGKDVLMQGSKTNEKPAGESSRGIAAELFGDALSDSEGDEDDLDRERDLDDESRISNGDEDSRLSDSQSQSQQDGSSKSFVTSFSKEMFATPGTSSHPRTKSPDKHAKSGKQQQQRRPSSASDLASLSRADLQTQLNEHKQQLTEISARRQIQETELGTTDNAALKNRLETVFNKLVNDQSHKEREIREVEMLLNSGQF